MIKRVLLLAVDEVVDVLGWIGGKPGRLGSGRSLYEIEDC